MPLDDRELATILAALRFWQRWAKPDGTEWDIATDRGHLKAMTPEEVDDLCERINLDD